MENTQEKIKTILHEYIEDGNKTVVSCFEEICKAINCSHEFTALTCLEEIMKNNEEIAEYNARHMYSNSAEFCMRNSKLYETVEKELKLSKDKDNEKIIGFNDNANNIETVNTKSSSTGNTSTNNAIQQPMPTATIPLSPASPLKL